MGWRCPCHRAMANRANKRLVARDESREQKHWPMALPRVRNVWIVSSARPPKVSVTRGIESIPTERQAGKLVINFLWTPIKRACPGEKAAFTTVGCWRGDITWMSKAAGRLPVQFGSEMSAGLMEESGTKLGVFLERSKSIADWAASKITSLMALWQPIQSVLPPQPTWWSPCTYVSL